MISLTDKLPKSVVTFCDWQRVNRYLPSSFNVILILACSYTLAQITWLLMPAEQGNLTPPTQYAAQNSAKTQSAQQQKIQNISQAHLFGEYLSSKPTSASAPETRLNLVLKGVLASIPMDHKGATAIISIGKSGQEKIYGLNDQVSSAKIKEIHADRVILERNGRFETLRLPKEYNSNASFKSARMGRGFPGRAQTPGQALGNIRDKIMRNPTSFGEFAIPIPYNENGKLRGYRLQPQKDRALFDQVGLNPNDVIVKINGIELNDPAKGLSALRMLQNAKQINVTVLRNGQEIPMSFNIP